MAKFVAETPDLTLELTTLTGEEVILTPKEILSGSRAKEIMKKRTELEEKQGKDKIGPIELLSKELEYVYDKPYTWWEKNFNVSVIQEIMTFVAKTVGGAKKK